MRSGKIRSGKIGGQRSEELLRTKATGSEVVRRKFKITAGSKDDFAKFRKKIPNLATESQGRFNKER